MDYAPYLVVCRDQTLPSAHEKFQWQEIVPRQEGTRDRGCAASCRDGNSSSTKYIHSHRRCHEDAQVPSSWHRLASAEFSSALDSVRSALRWRRPSPDKHKGVPSSSAVPQETVSSRPKRNTKKVSFADEVGLALTTVRIICDSVSSYLSLSPCSYYSVLAHRQPVVAPRFMVTFAQPWNCSDTFKQKVAKCNVILGNVVIKNYVISGEIEVKNIAYEKTVFVRYTGSDWNYFSDVAASYVARSEQKFSGYDTFSFQFSVPLDPEKAGRVEFAVGYVVSGQTFWDNNCGRNYAIVKFVKEPRLPTDNANCQTLPAVKTGGNGGRKPVQKRLERNTTDSIVFSVLQRTSVVWSEFIGWKWGMDHTIPYW